MFGKQKIAMLSAELLGTAILALTALVLSHTTAISYFVATAVGATLALLVISLGPLSGGHFNPAVTFGMWTARRIDTLQAIAYIAVQLFGAVLAWQLFEYLSGHHLETKNVKFDTPIWLAEVVGTFIFTMGITAAVTRGFDQLAKAATIGVSLFAGIMLAGVASAGILNPAIALSMRYWSSAYVFGPLLGAVLGVNLYLFLFAPAKEKEKEKAKPAKKA